MIVSYFSVMRLTHAERQQRYRKKHECNDEARHRLAARKRVIRSSNKKYASEEKKERERELQRVCSQRARDKKCLAKLNLKRRKNGQRAMTKAEHDNLLGRAFIPETQPLPPPPPPRPEPSRAPLRRSNRGRPVGSSDSDTSRTNTDMEDGSHDRRIIVNMDFHQNAMAKNAKHLRQARHELNITQRKMWRLEKKGRGDDSALADHSQSSGSEATRGPTKCSTPQPSTSGVQDRGKSPHLSPV